MNPEVVLLTPKFAPHEGFDVRVTTWLTWPRSRHYGPRPLHWSTTIMTRTTTSQNKSSGRLFRTQKRDVRIGC
ncbi:hypothetical protein ABKN59_003905 [Abortiporus biennis]